MRALLVSWFDAVSEDAWTEIDEAKKLQMHLIHTMGWLISEDKFRLVIGLSWDVEREAVSSFIAIPKSWITNVKVIDNPLYGVPTEITPAKARAKKARTAKKG
jgi:hypothetical protein